MKALSRDWEVRFDKEHGRNLFINHRTQTSTWIDPREGTVKKTKGLPYGWEVAHNKTIGPYMIDHTTWKTYLPEQVPELWLGYLNAKSGRSGRASHGNKGHKLGNSGVRSSIPNRRRSLRQRRSSHSSGLQQTTSAGMGGDNNNAMVGKLMKQMEVLHSELVSARVVQPAVSVITTQDKKVFSTALRAATEEIERLTKTRTDAEAEAAEEKLKLVVRKTRMDTRSAMAAKENTETSPKPKHKTSTGKVLQAAIGQNRKLRNKVRENCQALGAVVPSSRFVRCASA